MEIEYMNEQTRFRNLELMPSTDDIDRIGLKQSIARKSKPRSNPIRSQAISEEGEGFLRRPALSESYFIPRVESKVTQKKFVEEEVRERYSSFSTTIVNDEDLVIRSDSQLREETTFLIMGQLPPIDLLVRLRGLSIVVSRDLAVATIFSHLPKFYSTKDEDPSLHMERYIKVLTSLLIINKGYYLVWFPTTVQREAYEWYRDHTKGHFVD